MIPSECLFVKADHSLIRFASAKAAARGVPVDRLRNGPLTAFGPGGEPYMIGLNGNRIVISPTGEPKQSSKLRELLMLELETAGEAVCAQDDVTVLARRFWIREAIVEAERDTFPEEPIESRIVPFLARVGVITAIAGSFGFWFLKTV